MNARNIIYKLERIGGRVALDGDNLVVRAPRKVLAAALKEEIRKHKPEVVAYLKSSQVQSCNSCPWCRANPWTHDPRLSKWCGWWWDCLLTDNPQCIDRREGRVPDPKPKEKQVEVLTLSRPRETMDTCYGCGHFEPAGNSPNPAEAWGFCKRLKKGRYGVARVCDAFYTT